MNSIWLPAKLPKMGTLNGNRVKEVHQIRVEIEAKTDQPTKMKIMVGKEKYKLEGVKVYLMIMNR